MWKQRIAKCSVVLVSALTMVIALGGHASAAVDTCFWTGTTNANWSTGSNWSCTTDGATAPTSGDTVTLPAGSTNKAMNNDIVGLTLAQVNVNDMGYTLGGNSMSISGTTPITAAKSVTFSNNIAFTSTTNVFLRPATSAIVTLNGTSSFASVAPFEVNVGSAGETGTVDFVGNVSGTGGNQFIAVQGATINMHGASTLTASEIGVESGGLFQCFSASCFGNASNTIYIQNGFVYVYSESTFANPIVTGPVSATDHAYLAGKANVTFSGAVTVNDDLAVSQGTNNKTTTLSGNVSLAGDNIYLSANGTDAWTEILGVISGNHGVDVFYGQAALAGNNTYTGTTDVYGSTPGYLLVTHPNGLGASGGTSYTNVSSGSTLAFAFSSDATVAEKIYINGNGEGGNGALTVDDAGGTPTLTGDIILSSDATIGSYAMFFNGFNVNGVISGSHNLTLKSGSSAGGSITLAGASGNTYVGTTTIDGVGVTLDKTSGKAITGDVDVLASTTNEAALNLDNTAGNNDQLSNTANVTLTNNGANKALLIFSNSETLGMISGNGEIEFGAGTNTTLGGTNASGVFNGTIRRFSGSISKNGSGTWDLTGANLVSGVGNGPSINVNDGIVKVGGDLSTVNAMVNSGGKLMGTGSLFDTFVNNGGTLAIGNSPGCLTFSSLTLAAGSTYDQDVTGTTACSGYDKATVNSAVDLAGATLNVSQLAGFNPAVNQVFTIIDGTSLTGTFAGLANNAVFEVNGVRYRINYTATGEVTLTVVGADVVITATTPNSTLESTGSRLLPIVMASLIFIAAGLVVYKIKSQRAKTAL